MECNCPSCQRGRWITEAYESPKVRMPYLSQSEMDNMDRSWNDIMNEDGGRLEYYEQL